MTTAIIQARMGSQRLPGKVMMKILKKPILYFVINQIKQCKHVDKIIVATTTLSKDDVIHNYAKSLGVDTFRGNPSNVLDRYFQCAKNFSMDTIVRITADNPLIDPNIVDLLIDKYNNTKSDYGTNCLPRTFPYGTEVEIFSFKKLHEVWKNAKKPSEREHVTPYFYNHPDLFKIINLEYSKNISNLRWTIDREMDLKLFQSIVSKINHRPILLNDILMLYSKEPKLFELNKPLIQNEGYVKSLKDDEKNLKK